MTHVKATIEELNAMLGTDYKSWDELSRHNLLAVLCTLMIMRIEQETGSRVQIFECNPTEVPDAKTQEA